MTKRICKVLVVEDNRDIQALLELALIGDGYRFRAVSSSSEMQAALDSDETFDIAVIDYHFPGDRNGVTLAKTAASYGLGIILISGTAESTALDAMRETGHAYLQKPFRIKALLTAVEAALLLAQKDCERDPSGDCVMPALTL